MNPRLTARWTLAILLLTGPAGCAHRPRDAVPTKVAGLKAALLSLAPTVAETDADRLARCAYDHPRALAAEYRVVHPALLHNFLVNTGARERGLCHEWADDLLARFHTFDFGSFDLHWGVAREGTNREHNCIVVTARGQAFEHGILLDAWRHGGSLFWSHVEKDRYPWRAKPPDPPPPGP